MFCPKCGKENNDQASFCTGCGASFGDQGNPAATPEPAIRKSKIQKKTLFIVIIALVVLIGAASAVFALVSQKPSLDGTWKMSGTIDGISQVVPDVELTVDGDSFELDVVGAGSPFLILSFGGDDPIDISIKGNLNPEEEEGTSDLVYDVEITSIDPSDSMIQQLAEKYASQVSEQELRESIYGETSDALSNLREMEIQLHVPTDGLGSNFGVGEWFIDVDSTFRFGARLLENSASSGELQVFVSQNGNETLINEGSWQRDQDNRLTLSFPYFDTDTGLAEITINRQ